MRKHISTNIPQQWVDQTINQIRLLCDDLERAIRALQATIHTLQSAGNKPDDTDHDNPDKLPF